MSKGIAHQQPPRGPLRLLIRLPIWLYRLRLGWLMGQHFLLLTHIGRRSGRPRQTVLEVIDRDPTSGTVMVASGWGEQADWFQNLQKTPRALVDTGRQRYEARAERLAPEEGARAYLAYARRHPRAFRSAAPLLSGQPLTDDLEADCRALALVVPVVALRARG